MANFLRLVREEFYNGLTFHRVISGTVIQGGCPKGNGSGGPGYQIECELNQNLHRRGSLSMAHTGKDTGGSQFFVCLSTQPQLDGVYTVFGQVIEGVEIADQIQPGDKILKVTAL